MLLSTMLILSYIYRRQIIMPMEHTKTVYDNESNNLFVKINIFTIDILQGIKYCYDSFGLRNLVFRCVLQLAH